MTSQPLPCPFCGSNEAFIDIDEGGMMGVYYGVVCRNGTCSGRMDSNYATKDFAIAAWNTRTPIPPPVVMEAMTEAAQSVFMRHIPATAGSVTWPVILREAMAAAVKARNER